MKATIKDVARAAGVSPSTVSRALHDSPRISEKVRERVKQAAKALDFHPNQMAKSLVSRKTRIVGIVFPGDVSKSLGNPFYPSLLQGLGRAAGERRYHLLLVTGGGEVSAEEASRQAVDSGYVSGLVLLAAEDVPTRDPGVPVVVIGHPRDEAGWHYVDNDNVAAGRAATQHLLAHRHRRILLLGYDRRYIFTVDRRLGYEQALDDAGIKVRKAWIVTSRPIQEPDASEKLIAIFRAKDRPTAAVCMDDTLAIGLTGLLKGMGLDVPGDVSIVSFNNTDAGKYHIPALTSFEIDPYRLGMSAMHLMADVLKGTVDAPRSIEVPFTLIERDSVGGAPASE